MSSNLARRGAIWWARLVVPAHLREVAGKREFIQSCRTHELAIAKLVAAVLLSDWRRLLLKLDSRTMTVDVLKLVDGSHALTGGGWLPISEAVSESGISYDQLLRLAADGDLKLFCRVSQLRGYVVEREALEPVYAMAGRSGGVVIPPPQLMPASAVEESRTGVLQLSDSDAVAAAVIVGRLRSIDIVAFDVPGHSSALFAPDAVVTVNVGNLEVLAADIEAVRQRLAQAVSPGAIERARELQNAAPQVVAPARRNAYKLFSEALEAYAAAPSGIAGSVASMAEQKQKHRGCALFIELVGDLPLSDITVDRLREFREKLKVLPAKVNNIPKQYRRETMAATVCALEVGGVEWPTMTVKAQHERMLWVGQMFAWLVAQKWVTENPATTVLSEQTQTAAARKVQRQVAAAQAVMDDDSDRRAFTVDELKLIFSQPHYKTGHGAHVKGNAKWYPFQYWLPLVGLLAGCRIGEICQLRLNDIRESEDGTWYFDICETTPDKSLKNANAVRQIPVSPVLVELGLIAYRDRLEKEGYQRLFAELTYSNSDARYAKEPIRKMSAMLEGLGMSRDSTRVFHCLRANFNDAMLRVPFTELPFDDPDLKRFIRLKVIGHKLEGVNENHYSSTTMTEKFALVKGVQYDLPKISKFDIEDAVKAVRNGLKNKKGHRRGVEDMGPPN